MRLRVRRLRIEVESSERAFAADVTLADGLNVIRADNSAGKSTLLSGITYALGLEGALSPRHEVPFPRAVTSNLEWNGESFYVTGSRVWLELEGRGSERVCIRRDVVGGDPGLVQTWHGTDMERLALGRRADYFVRRPGAAVREHGFHHFLAGFVGAALPVVPTYDGREVPLYLECLFPQVFVEQKQGWGLIRGLYPRWYKIREVHTRVLEYLLQLRRIDVARQREALLSRKRDLFLGWQERVKGVAGACTQVGFSLSGVPREPIVDERLVEGTVSRLTVSPDGERANESLADHLRLLTKRANELRSTEPPATSVVAKELEREIESRTTRLRELEVRLGEALRQRETERGNRVALDARLAGIAADIRRYRDILVLKQLGSALDYKTASDGCPTCGQKMNGALLPGAASVHVNTEGESVAYLQQKEQVFRVVRAQIETRLNELASLVASLEQSVRDGRSRVQSLRQTLLADVRAPNRAMVEELVRLDDRIGALRRLGEQVELMNGELALMARAYAGVVASLKTLESQRAEDEDSAIVQELSNQFRELCTSFGIGRLEASSLTVTEDSLEPRMADEETDVQHELSASDTVRAAWAFRLALMRVSARRNGEHPGFLVLDEPRQQSARLSSFGALLRAAAKVASDAHAQVVIATSEEEYETLKAAVRGPSVTWSVLPAGYVLRPVAG